MPEYTNDLIHETSPYLLQHAHNPVNWQAWGDKALDEARDSKKLIIVSVGYAACHWCHVMEHESFENEEVAALMNEHYVSIKVDREERPDVDQVYMDAAQLLTGRGGWPLNVIALPDGRPIYAGTYFTREQWLKVLTGVYDFYVKTPEKNLAQAIQVAAGDSKKKDRAFDQESAFQPDLVKAAAADWLNAMDNQEGGRAGQMKFPMPGSYLALLRYGVATGDQRAKDLVRLTLDKMASGGLYDQIGSGFARYSVDPRWHVPHFEKMLYDNAQLITLYSEAYKYFKDPFYLQVVNETIAFCLRELQSPEGGFMSSIDADSEGEEGQFYVWTAAEIDEVLGPEAELFKDFYGVTEAGNWEDGKNVLIMSSALDELKTKFNLEEEEIGMKLTMARQVLFGHREQRERPGLDDKILTSWNALMITAFTHAFEASGNGKFRQLAVDTASFIRDNLWVDHRLRRSFKGGKATINAFLEDYALLIAAYIRLYSITFDRQWLDRADELQQLVLEEYTQLKSDFFNFKSSRDKELFVSKQVLEDNVIPAGNSEIAKTLNLLGTLLEKQEYLDLSRKMILQLAPRIKEHAAFYYNWFDLYNSQTAKFLEIAIVGRDWDQQRREVSKLFTPYGVFLGGETANLGLLEGKLMEGKTPIYICLDKTCQAPVMEVAEEDLKTIYEK